MFVGKSNYWETFQTGIILATQTVLDMQEPYTNNEQFKYLMLERLRHNALENLSNLKILYLKKRNLNLHLG